MHKRFISFAIFAFAVAAFALPHPTAGIAASPDGKAIYDGKCAACHQANGQGTAGAFPPLAGNKDVTGDPKKAITAVVKGMTGPLTVGGKTYNGAMPAWHGQLSDAEIAAVLTYVRSSWGNKASKITEKQVSSIK